MGYGLLCPWGFPGERTRAGCHFLLQGIFLAPGVKPESPALQADSLPLSHQGGLQISGVQGPRRESDLHGANPKGVHVRKRGDRSPAPPAILGEAAIKLSSEPLACSPPQKEALEAGTRQRLRRGRAGGTWRVGGKVQKPSSPLCPSSLPRPSRSHRAPSRAETWSRPSVPHGDCG